MASAAGVPAKKGPAWPLVSPASALALAGVVLCVFTVARSGEDNIILDSVAQNALVVLYNSVRHAGWVFGFVTGADTLFASLPRQTGLAAHLMAYSHTAYECLILLLAIAGLAYRPLLAFAGLAAMWGLSLFFVGVYPSGYRHQGLLLIFLLTLYWLAEARSDPSRWPRGTSWLRRLGLYVVLPLLLLINCVLGAQAAIDERRQPYSSSHQLAEILNSRDDLKQAVVVSELDYMLEALPYYVANRLYLVRLSRYDNLANWTRQQKLDLSLGELLLTARRLRSETGSPIVILLQDPLDRPQGDVLHYYGYRFTWNEAELAQLRREASHLASLRNAITDENYDVYLLQ